MSTSVTDYLNTLLADPTVLFQKLRHYHCNVQGQDFLELHLKFEEVYNNWVVFIDEIAERVIALDTIPLHSLNGPGLVSGGRLTNGSFASCGKRRGARRGRW